MYSSFVLGIISNSTLSFFLSNNLLNVFMGDHRKNLICRRCLNSNTGEKLLMIYERKCGNIDKATIRTSPESNIHWKKHFHNNPLHFRIYADFEAENENDKSSIGDETTSIYKQKPVLNCFHIISELEDVLKRS